MNATKTDELKTTEDVCVHVYVQVAAAVPCDYRTADGRLNDQHVTLVMGEPKTGEIALYQRVTQRHSGALEWRTAPVRTQWGDGMMVADVALDKDSTVTLYCHKGDSHKVAAALGRVMFGTAAPTAPPCEHKFTWQMGENRSRCELCGVAQDTEATAEGTDATPDMQADLRKWTELLNKS